MRPYKFVTPSLVAAILLVGCSSGSGANEELAPSSTLAQSDSGDSELVTDSSAAEPVGLSALPANGASLVGEATDSLATGDGYRAEVSLRWFEPRPVDTTPEMVACYAAGISDMSTFRAIRVEGTVQSEDMNGFTWPVDTAPYTVAPRSGNGAAMALMATPDGPPACLQGLGNVGVSGAEIGFQTFEPNTAPTEPARFAFDVLVPGTRTPNNPNGTVGPETLGTYDLGVLWCAETSDPAADIDGIYGVGTACLHPLT